MNILRLIYQGRFLHDNVTLGGECGCFKSNQIKFISGDKAHSTNTDDHKTHTHTHTPKHVKRK